MADASKIKKGTRIKVTDAPSGKVIKYGDTGTAQGSPGGGGLFWAVIDGKGKFNLRASEVDVI